MGWLAERSESWTCTLGLEPSKLTDRGRVEAGRGGGGPELRLGPGTGEGAAAGLSAVLAPGCSSGGAGELTQLAVSGFTTDRSSSGERGQLGLGVSAVRVIASEEKAEAGGWRGRPGPGPDTRPRLPGPALEPAEKRLGCCEN